MALLMTGFELHIAVVGLLAEIESVGYLKAYAAALFCLPFH